MKLKFILTAFMLFTFVHFTLAHYIWIETDSNPRVGGEQLIKIYYGEYNEGVREKRGGKLEELEGITAWIIDPNGKKIQLTVIKDALYFKTSFIPKQEGKYVVVAVNEIREVLDWRKYDIGIIRPVYYTSREIQVGNSGEVVSGKSHMADFMITKQPNAGDEKSFTLFFKGQPLANAKVLFHAPNEWSKELKTDANGVVSITPPWNGMYVVECIYPEKVPGNFKGKQYETIRHRVTYTFGNN